MTVQEVCLQRNIRSPAAVGEPGSSVQPIQGGSVRRRPGSFVRRAPDRDARAAAGRLQGYSPAAQKAAYSAPPRPWRMAPLRSGFIPSTPSFSISRAQ
jgi:hypothetical protein